MQTRFTPRKSALKGQFLPFFTVFGRETAVFSLEDRFLFHKKLLLIKIHLQNPKHGGANQVYPPKIDPKGSILAIFTVFGRETAVFPWKTVYFFHKKLLLIKIDLQNPKHGGANQVYPLNPLKLALKGQFLPFLQFFAGRPWFLPWKSFFIP